MIAPKVGPTCNLSVTFEIRGIHSLNFKSSCWAEMSSVRSKGEWSRWFSDHPVQLLSSRPSLLLGCLGNQGPIGGGGVILLDLSSRVWSFLTLYAHRAGWTVDPSLCVFLCGCEGTHCLGMVTGMLTSVCQSPAAGKGLSPLWQMFVVSATSLTLETKPLTILNRVPLRDWQLGCASSRGNAVQSKNGREGLERRSLEKSGCVPLLKAQN